MDISTRQFVVIVLSIVLLVSLVGIYGVVLQDSNQTPTNNTTDTQTPTTTETPTETPTKNSNFSSFSQEQTEDGYTMSIALSNDSKYTYDNIIIQVTGAVNYPVMYNNRTQLSINYEQTKFTLSNGTEQLGYDITSPILFKSLPEGTTITVYHTGSNTQQYTKIKEHTITGNDTNYNITITVENLNSSLDGVGAGIGKSDEIKVASENETITFTNVTTSKQLIFGVWIDKSSDGELKQSHISPELIQPSYKYIGQPFYFHQSQYSETYQFENATIRITAEEHTTS